jgi:hypothetical protein
MYVSFTNESGMYVSGFIKGANENEYRMFDAVLVIFTNDKLL